MHKTLWARARAAVQGVAVLLRRVHIHAGQDAAAARGLGRGCRQRRIVVQPQLLAQPEQHVGPRASSRAWRAGSAGRAARSRGRAAERAAAAAPPGPLGGPRGAPPLIQPRGLQRSRLALRGRNCGCSCAARSAAAHSVGAGTCCVAGALLLRCAGGLRHARTATRSFAAGIFNCDPAVWPAGELAGQLVCALSDARALQRHPARPRGLLALRRRCACRRRSILCAAGASAASVSGVGLAGLSRRACAGQRLRRVVARAGGRVRAGAPARARRGRAYLGALRPLRQQRRQVGKQLRRRGAVERARKVLPQLVRRQPAGPGRPGQAQSGTSSDTTSATGRRRRGAAHRAADAGLLTGLLFKHKLEIYHMLQS